jgi:hypothetical protein
MQQAAVDRVQSVQPQYSPFVGCDMHTHVDAPLYTLFAETRSPKRLPHGRATAAEGGRMTIVHAKKFGTVYRHHRRL